MLDGEMSQEDFLKAFGVSGEADQNTQDANNADVNDDTTPNDTTPEGDESEGNDTNQDGDNNQNDASTQNNATKTTQAFAAMRVENAKQKKLINNTLTLLGLDPKNPDSVAQLETKLTEALAKKQGLPVETLERLNKLEALEQQRTAEDLRTKALMGFQKVKDSFNLDDNALQEFANELVAEGKNPFINSLDLVSEYKLRNFDKLIEQAKAKGVQEEIERASKANNNASTPNSTQGGDTQNIDKVTNIKELVNWYNQQQSGK